MLALSVAGLALSISTGMTLLRVPEKDRLGPPDMLRFNCTSKVPLKYLCLTRLLEDMSIQ